jgi:hypothetical protein
MAARFFEIVERAQTAVEAMASPSRATERDSVLFQGWLRIYETAGTKAL